MLQFNLPKLSHDELVTVAAATGDLVRFQTLSWRGLLRWFRKSDLALKSTAVLGPSLEGLSDKELVERMLPRSRLDLSIRRFKWRDIWPGTDAALKLEMRYYQHLDIVFATNILLWGRLFGADKLTDLRLLGIFNSVDHFLDRAGLLSAYVKRFPYDPSDIKQMTAEIGGLVGYLTTDTASWDTVSELEALSKGGNEHGLITDNWAKLFPSLITRIKNGRRAPKFVTFEEFVKTGSWITSGSSSIGKVQWEYDEKKGKFKAKKNMLFELYSPDELWQLALGWDGTLRSRAFIKSEAGKRRLAVSSNLESYLYESYLLRLYGHSFKNWDYITLDESAATQHNRSAKTVALLAAGAWALPFDFARFDHQPTTWEIQSMVDNLASEVRVPASYQATFQTIKTKIVNSYARSGISMMVDGTVVSHKVTGGIPSGVRITSLIGNQWNSIMTTRARDVATSMLGYDPALFIQIKGDDTAVFCRTAIECWIFRLAYQAINAIGLDSKFGISQNVCEFLRNEASPTGLRGWTNRTIPTLTQRKPWTAQPWSPSRDVTTLANNIRTLERRLGDTAPWLHHANAIKWSRLMRQSYHWLHLPIRAGGLGVYEFAGWVPSRKLPLVTKPIVLTNTRQATEADGPQWLPISLDVRTKYIQHAMSEKIAFDDIPGPQQAFFSDYVDSVRSMEVQWHRDLTILQQYRQVKIKAERHTIKLPSFGTGNAWPSTPRPSLTSKHTSVPPFPQWVREYMALKRIWIKDYGILPRFMDLAELFFPNIARNIREFERLGWHRADAIDLASGNIPTEPNSIMHPILTDYLRAGLIEARILRWKNRAKIAINLAAFTLVFGIRIQNSRGGALYKY